MQDVHEGVGIPSHRTPEGGCEHLSKPLIARGRLGDCGGENAAYGDRELLGIVQHLA